MKEADFRDIYYEAFVFQRIYRANWDLWCARSLANTLYGGLFKR